MNKFIADAYAADLARRAELRRKQDAAARQTAQESQPCRLAA